MKLRFRNLILSSAALCATAAFAAEQKRVEVPFSFVAKNHAYHAGSYAVTVDWTRSMVTLSEIARPSHQLAWIMLPGDNGPSDSKVRLTFNVTGTDHVLRTIQYETFTTPNLDRKPKSTAENITAIGD